METTDSSTIHDVTDVRTTISSIQNHTMATLLQSSTGVILTLNGSVTRVLSDHISTITSQEYPSTTVATTTNTLQHVYSNTASSFTDTYQNDSYPQCTNGSSTVHVFELDIRQRHVLYILCAASMMLNMVLFIWKGLQRKVTAEHSITGGNLSCAGFLHGVSLLQLILMEELPCEMKMSTNRHVRNMCMISGVLQLSSHICIAMTLVLITTERLRRTKRVLLPTGLPPITLAAFCGITWIISLLIALVPLSEVEFFEDKFYSTEHLCFPSIVMSMLPNAHIAPYQRTYVSVACILGPGCFYIWALGMFLATLIRRKRLQRFWPREEDSNQEDTFEKEHLPKKNAVISTLNLLAWSPALIFGM